jgi:hypothetical protein
VIDIANKHFIPLVEGVYEMADLVEADEIFPDVFGNWRRAGHDVRLPPLRHRTGKHCQHHPAGVQQADSKHRLIN